MEDLDELVFRGNALKLFDSYLSNTEQLVEIDKTPSEMRIVESGVPKGTVLGPILLIICININIITSQTTDNSWLNLKNKVDIDMKKR